MTKLLDDEIEEDELFWNQEALKEVLYNAIYLFFKKFVDSTLINCVTSLKTLSVFHRKRRISTTKQSLKPPMNSTATLTKM